MRWQFILIVLLASLAVTLTVGQAFGFTWAGGEGYLPNQDLMLTMSKGQAYINHAGKTINTDDQNYLERGEIITTEAESYLELEVLGTKIYLDERTTIELIRSNKLELDLLVTRGRVFVDATNGTQEVFLRSHYLTSFFVKGQASLVNYDFRRTVSLIPFATPVVFETDNGEMGLIKEAGIDYLEVDPFTITDFKFDHRSSSAAEFYTWVAGLTDIID